MQPTLPATDQHQTQTIPKCYQQNQKNQAIINPANTVTNFLGNPDKTILLQTANAEVVNLDNRSSEKCNILFDSGAHRTYITQSLKDKLNLIQHGIISIKVLGTTASRIQEIEIVKFKVKFINKNIFVKALIIPTIFPPKKINVAIVFC